MDYVLDLARGKAPPKPQEPEDYVIMFYLDFNQNVTRFPVPIQYLDGKHKLCFSSGQDCRIRVQFGDRDDTRSLGGSGSSNMDLPDEGSGGMTVKVTRMDSDDAKVGCVFSDRS